MGSGRDITFAGPERTLACTAKHGIAFKMKRYFRNYLLFPSAAAILVIGMCGCNNRGNSPRDGEKADYAPNGNGASPGGGAGTGGSRAGSENGQTAGNSGSGGASAASGNGGGNSGGSGGEASTPASRP
jgi:hypothetical protein